MNNRCRSFYEVIFYYDGETNENKKDNIIRIHCIVIGDSNVCPCIRGKNNADSELWVCRYSCE